LGGRDQEECGLRAARAKKKNVPENTSQPIKIWEPAMTEGIGRMEF
jgi:hypothetical protein